jgi:hypothetical protein
MRHEAITDPHHPNPTLRGRSCAILFQLVLRRSSRTILLFAIVLGGCGGGSPPEGSEDSGAEIALSAAPTSLDAPEEVFDREFIFLSLPADSTLFLPWLFRTRVHSGGIQRAISARIARSGSWEILEDEQNDTPMLRNPARILPSSRIRLIAGNDSQIESLYFNDPPRVVETELLEILTEWPRPGGESIFLYRGRVILPSMAVNGIVLDLARRWSLPTNPIGDWIFLHGEGGVQLFLEEVLPLQGQRGNTRYRGWIRIDPGAGPWAAVQVRWEEMRPFERARRDIPARWSFSTPGGDLDGELVATSSDLVAIEGEGPILPLTGLFQVEGEVRVVERVIRVAGLIRHQQY